MDWKSGVSGSVAGLAVDLTLFPIDTIKTRLQAEGGLAKNGRFKGLYEGMGSVAVGSAPGGKFVRNMKI